MYKSCLKRLLDFLFALFGLLILAPLLIIAALFVRINSPGPVFFTQERLGRGGKVFKVYKFRSMTNVIRSYSAQVFQGDAEVTFVGGVLRRFKIDELPQLWNVLVGDMSLVGPRPCLPSQLSDFDENGRSRLAVRPGITGLAQINGNIFLSWPERWVFDRKYVENLSFLLDCRIVLATAVVVVLGEEKFVR